MGNLSIKVSRLAGPELQMLLSFLKKANNGRRNNEILISRFSFLFNAGRIKLHNFQNKTGTASTLPNETIFFITIGGGFGRVLLLMPQPCFHLLWLLL